MDKLKYIKLENEDGSYSSSIPLAVDSNYVDVNGDTLTNVLETKASVASVENLATEITSVASGSPAGVYETVAALTAADPDHTKIYVVTANGHWYYYSNSSWVSGGEYQSSEDSHTVNELVEDVENIKKIEIGINLINQEKSTHGYLKSSGNIDTGGTYDNYYTSEFIPVDQGTYYLQSYLKSDGSLSQLTRGYMLYDENKGPLSETYATGASGTSGNTINVSSTEKYIRVLYRNIVNPSLTKTGIRVNYIPYEETYINKMLLDVNNKVQTVSDAFNAKISKISKTINLVDPNKMTPNTFISNYGGLSDNNLYDTTDFIPVYENQPIAISRCRGYMMYKNPNYPVPSTFNNENITTNRIVTPTFDGYIRCSVEKGQTTQINYGSTVAAYSPYNSNVYIEENIKLSDSLIEEIKSLNLSNTNDKLEVTINNNTLTIESTFGENTLKRTYNKQTGKNNVFNYNQAYLNDTNIKNSNDDITPQRIKLGETGLTQRTVGANHGWICSKIPKSSLTSEDSGSIWTDGVIQVVLLKVDDTYAYFSYPCSKSNGVITISSITFAGNLTHVSGATHTSELSITGISYGEDLSPSVNHNTVDYYINDNKVTEDGIYYTNKFIVKEHYEIMDYYEIVEYMKNHIGSELNTVKNNIQSIVALDFVYEIDELNEIIYSTLTAIEDVTIADSGFAQAFVLNAGSGTVYRYVNNVASGTFASNNLVDMTNYNTSIDIYKSYMSNPNIAVNRCVDLSINSNNKILYGFTFGFLPNKSSGSDEYRKQLSIQWNMRNSKKSYPYCIYNKSLNEGDVINVATYRHYILPDQDITNKTLLHINNNDYIIIDSHNSFSTNVNSEKYGADVTSLNNNGCTYTNLVGANGVNVKSSESYSDCVLTTN